MEAAAPVFIEWRVIAQETEDTIAHLAVANAGRSRLHPPVGSARRVATNCPTRRDWPEARFGGWTCSDEDVVPTGATIAAVLILLMGAAFLTQVVPYGQIVDSRRQVSSARAQLAALEAENAALEADIAALETDAEVEKLAREKLGYVRPGETAYVVLDPPGTSEETEPAIGGDRRGQDLVDKVWGSSGADQGSVTVPEVDTERSSRPRSSLAARRVEVVPAVISINRLW
jgi:cell division protein FtsB